MGESTDAHSKRKEMRQDNSKKWKFTYENLQGKFTQKIGKKVEDLGKNTETQHRDTM